MTDFFCHCHSHSTRSFFDGLTPVDDLVERAAELGQPGMAITDHGNVFAAAQFFKACKKHNIKGVVGMEAYEAIPDQWDLERDKPLLSRKWDEGPRYHHLTIWVQNLTGWENLCALHSASYTEQYKPKNQPLIDRWLLEQHADGLIIGLGCLASKTNWTLATSGEDSAYETAAWYKERFEDRVFCEVMGNLPEQQALMRSQRRVAGRLGIPIIGTNDVHYRDKIDGVEHGAHHVVVQARAFKTKVTQEKSSDRSDVGYGRWYGTDEFYMKSGAEMLATGGIQKDEVERTLDLLGMVDFDFAAMQEPDPPVAPVPEPGEDPEFDAFFATVGT